MGLFDWLFGKTAKPAAAPAAEHRVTSASVAVSERAPAPAAASACPAVAPEANKPRAQPVPVRATLEPSRAEAPEVRNLRQWKESGQARAWVESRNGQWGHAEWLALLDALRGSHLWPMQPEAIGLTLEETRREWLQRRNGVPAGR